MTPSPRGLWFLCHCSVALQVAGILGSAHLVALMVGTEPVALMVSRDIQDMPCPRAVGTGAQNRLFLDAVPS